MYIYSSIVLKAAVWSFERKVDLVRVFEWSSSQVPPSSSLICCSAAFKDPPTQEPVVLEQWWGILKLGCCLFSLFTVAQKYLTRWEQALHMHGGGALPSALCEGEELPVACGQEWLTLLRHSSWLWLVVLSQERRILADQVRATGWSHRQLTYILFNCQIIMTILANTTTKSYRLQL